MKGLARILAGFVLAVFCLALPSEDAPDYHKKWMKDLGNQMGSLRKNIEVEKNASAMAEILKEVGGFWEKRPSDVAMKSCKNTRDGALAVVKAAQSNDTAGVSAGMKMVGAGCKGCHDTHREKISETEYKIK